MYDKRNSIIALDDDKLRVSGKRAGYYGPASKKIGGGFGPIQHSTVSIATGLFLGGHLEKIQDSVEDCTMILLMGLEGSSLPKQAQISNLITKDRGYNTLRNSMLCLKRGAHELGTRRKEGNFVFTFDTAPRRGQKLIPTSGEQAGYFAKLNPLISTRSNLRLYGIAFRRYGRVAILQSSKAQFRPFIWHLILKGSSQSKVPVSFESLRGFQDEPAKRIEFKVRESSISPDDVYEYTSTPEGVTKELIDKMYECFRRSITFLTEEQGTPEWFLLRKFRLTSSVSGGFCTKWLRSLSQAEAQELGRAELIRSIGYKFLVAPSDASKQEALERLRKLKKPKIVEICKRFEDSLEGRGRVAVTGNKQVLVQRLLEAGYNPLTELEAAEEGKSFEQVLHDLWFMRPAERQSLRMGFANERFVIQWLGPFIRRYARKFILCEVRSYGLLAVSKSPYMATSIDGLAILADKEKRNIRAVCLEMNNRLSSNNRDKIEDIRHDHGRWIELNALDDTKRLHQVIPERNYRQQLLQHASVIAVRDIL